jgi:geranylgeranyl reductase family protein
MTRFDAVVVGAGPAGCRAACALARGGMSVAIVDGSHPREKPCGGGVTGRALALVQDTCPTGRLPAVRVSSAAFEHGARLTRMPLERGASETRIDVLARRIFDGALLAAATSAGARHIAERVTALRRTNGSWTITTRAGELQAEWILGADGPNSFVRRTVSRPFARTDLSIATGYYVHGATSREIGIAFEDSPAGYLWSFPRPDHVAAGICAQADVSSVGLLSPVVRRWIDRHQPDWTSVDSSVPPRLERYSWPIPSLTSGALERERPAGAHWMLLGDAAGLVDPITREGIFFALLSGDAAAAALLGHRDPAQDYIRALRDTIYGELIRAARLKASFFRPRFMGLLVHAVTRSAGIREVMADLISGDQPYRGLRRRLLGTFEWQLMLELAYRTR